MNKPQSTIKTRIEQISFESNNTYMDVESQDGYVDITIGGTKGEKFSVTLVEWQEISAQIIKILKQ